MKSTKKRSKSSRAPGGERPDEPRQAKKAEERSAFEEETARFFADAPEDQEERRAFRAAAIASLAKE